jgi:hypothetical protein
VRSVPCEFRQCRVQTAYAEATAVHRSLWRRWKDPAYGVNEASAEGAVENGVQSIGRECCTVFAHN